MNLAGYGVKGSPHIASSIPLLSLGSLLLQQLCTRWAGQQEGWARGLQPLWPRSSFPPPSVPACLWSLANDKMTSCFLHLPLPTNGAPLPDLKVWWLLRFKAGRGCSELSPRGGWGGMEVLWCGAPHHPTLQLSPPTSPCCWLRGTRPFCSPRGDRSNGHIKPPQFLLPLQPWKAPEMVDFFWLLLASWNLSRFNHYTARFYLKIKPFPGDQPPQLPVPPEPKFFIRSNYWCRQALITPQQHFKDGSDEKLSIWYVIKSGFPYLLLISNTGRETRLLQCFLPPL